jgi:uncharacterized membrane protein
MNNPSGPLSATAHRARALIPARGESHWAALLALGGASAACLALLIARVAVTRSWEHGYLVWNLFLAWVPLGCAVATARLRGRPMSQLVTAALWLLFLPNAPYLVTDLVHLRLRGAAPLWFDIVLLQAFVLTGLLLGLWSLEMMRGVAAAVWPRRWVLLALLLVVVLCGFGIYLGRVERWNSWDLFTQPVMLLGRLAEIGLHPFAHRRAIGFSAVHAGLVGAAYAIWRALARCPRGVADSPLDPDTAGVHVRGAP